MKDSQFVFTCLSCGHPCAQTVEPSVDIHSGAGYTCEECQASIIFEVMTERRYDAYCSLLPEIREAEEKAL